MVIVIIKLRMPDYNQSTTPGDEHGQNPAMTDRKLVPFCWLLFLDEQPPLEQFEEVAVWDFDEAMM